ncbi:MAG: SMP-30/gluconolactonase/LRE family protein [Bacteroidales bacterium]|nr:SMP-30/gluconolactonase/LRE family protein [Bacteroidales bacterium]
MIRFKTKPGILFTALFWCFILHGQQDKLPENLVQKDAQVTKVGNGYLFTEGASVAPDGSVFFTDQPNNRIFRWYEEGEIHLFADSAQRSNGTWCNRRGYLYCCADEHNRIIRYSPDGNMEIMYEGLYEGRRLNGPNDLWVDARGGIYFTDPYYHRNYWESERGQEIKVQGVYYVSPSGKLVQVIDDLEQPNGIVGTPNGNYLYVADIRAGVTWRYRINSDGSLQQKTRFAPAGSDGMTIDRKGNVYLTSGKVLIFDKNGNPAGEIALAEHPSNVCFGGKDRRTLFITARTSVYTLKMKVKGVM